MGHSDQPEKVGGPGPTRHLVHGAEDQVVLRVPHQTKHRSHVIIVLCILDETHIHSCATGTSMLDLSKFCLSAIATDTLLLARRRQCRLQ
jgi:hypothetical protein